MNKKKIDSLLPAALSALKECAISDEKNTTILKSYRSAIASFGAAVTMGSFKAAVAFFSEDADPSKSKISWSELIRAMYRVSAGVWLESSEICKIILNDPNDALKDTFLHASVALKLAMNAFDLVDDTKDVKENDHE